jgi:hypothetical protein
MRFVPALTLSLAMLLVPALASGPAQASDLKFHGASVLPPTGPPPARTPSVLKGSDPKIERFDDDRRPGRPHRPGHPHHPGHGFHRPVFVFVSPGRCWQPGYWTYQWVPQTYTYSTWVPGQWSADGYWIEGHYAPSQVSSGYYHPLWVEGYYASC